MRSLLVVLLMVGCGGGSGGVKDAGHVDGAVHDGAAIDAPAMVDAHVDAAVTTIDAAGGTLQVGEQCGADAVDGGGSLCAAGLACCYPCGIPGCKDQCTMPCMDGPGCSGGCPLLP